MGIKFIKIVVTVISVYCVSACSLNASWNKNSREIEPSKASYQVTDRGEHEKVLFVIASSGGGSRAAYFTASTMLKLQSISTGKSNLLAEVDAMSPVSGSALPTAYYAISKNPEEDCKSSVIEGKGNSYSRPVWDEKTVRKMMSGNFQRNWILRWFLPQNILRFWFTAFDRSDIMAQVYANTLFDRNWSLGSYSMGEICTNRPNLIINASVGSSGDARFDRMFTFTDRDFQMIESSINRYPLANAVMSSSAFPVAFNFTTLRDFSVKGGKPSYLHLFDGGTADNLGITSALTIIAANKKKYDRIVLLLIDSYTRPKGPSSELYDPRSLFDFIADTNFLDSVNVMMGANRDTLVRAASDTVQAIRATENKQTIFCHLRYSSVADEEFENQLNGIKTAFSITPENTELLDRAVDELISEDVIQDLVFGVTGEGVPSGACDSAVADFLPATD